MEKGNVLSSAGIFAGLQVFLKLDMLMLLLLIEVYACGLVCTRRCVMVLMWLQHKRLWDGDALAGLLNA
jgi:hypothetical protein